MCPKAKDFIERNMFKDYPKLKVLSSDVNIWIAETNASIISNPIRLQQTLANRGEKRFCWDNIWDKMTRPNLGSSVFDEWHSQYSKAFAKIHLGMKGTTTEEFFVRKRARGSRGRQGQGKGRGKAETRLDARIDLCRNK
ncbi:hypothetical protein CFP56_033171 [Quercus suber]|uniref:Uncharacterized protein n=1 Tax=Quercus suber TaxID=58331 RepID=A0AAW0MAE9_QUESU